VASLSGRPNAVVSPVVFRSAEVRAILARAEDDRLVEDLVQTTSVSPVAPHRASFALALSAEGATLMEQAALGGVLPVGVAYEMQFLALTPAIHARVRMDYERIYDHFSAAVGITYYYVQAKFDLDLTWLIEHDLIDIEITSFLDDEDQQRQQKLVMDLVTARVQQDFFRTGIPPAPQPGAGNALSAMLGQLLGGNGSNVTSASAFFVLKAKLEVVRETKVFELFYDGRTAVQLTHVSTGLLADLVAGGPPPTILELDLDDSFFSILSVDVVSTIDFAQLPDLARAVVHLEKGDFHRSFEFAPDTQERGRFEVPLTDPRDDRYSATFELHFSDISTGDPVLVTSPVETRERVLVLNPFEQVEYTRIRLLLGPVDAALVPRIHVLLRLLGSNDVEIARGSVSLDAAQPELLWRHHQLPEAVRRVLVTTEWEDARGNRHDGQRAQLPPGESSFVALGPFVDVMRVSVVPAVDWAAGATHAQVEVRYVDGDYVVDRTLTFLAADGPAAQTVDVPLLDTTKLTYQWRQVVFLPSGPEQTDWHESSERVLVFGGARKTSEDVRLVWVGDGAGSFGLRIDFRVTGQAAEQVVSTFLRTGVDTDKVVAVPLDSAGRLNYRFEVRRIGAEGEVFVQAGEGMTNLLVVRAA
jgi:hypothetical protein